MKRWTMFPALILVASSSFAAAATIHVTPTGGGDGTTPATPTTLAAALNAARQNGESDTIRVAQGTYVGNFTYGPVAEEDFDLTMEGGWSADFLSRTLDPANTTLDGDRDNRVLAIYKAQVSASGSVTLEGFTIRGGLSSSDGGGIYIDSFPPGTVTVRRNIIEDNETADTGGGLWVANIDEAGKVGGPVHIVDNVIRNNVAASGQGATAGGVRVNALGGLLVANNLIHGNRVGGNPAFFGAGGGLYIPVIGGPVQIINNTVTGNTAYTDAGGMQVGSFGLAGYPAQEVQISNNIIRSNVASTGEAQDLLLRLKTDPGNTLDVGYNDFEDLVVAAERLAPTLAGNIDADPKFVDTSDPDPAGWDLRIQPDSPCIDAGDNAAPELPATDLLGKPRVSDGDADGNAVVDMGAYEVDSASRIYQVTPTSDDDCSDLDCDLQSALAAAGADGKSNIVRVAQGTYTGNFIYSGAPTEDFALILEGGWSLDFSTRVLDPASTVIDGGGTDRALVIDSSNVSAGGNVTVEGFTVRNGFHPSDGGGIRIISRPPGTVTLHRNIIERNEAGAAGGGLLLRNEDSVEETGGPIVITGNIIRSNVAASGSNSAGGGAQIFSASALVFAGNLVHGNSVGGNPSFDGWGGGINLGVWAGTASIVHNTITGNSAHTDGGGMFIWGSGWGTAQVTLANNILWGNSVAAGSGADFYSEMDTTPGNALTLSHDDVHDIATSAAGLDPTLVGTIDVDPLFVETADPDPALWNLTLPYGSPCIDAGDNSAPDIPEADFLGKDRILDGDGDGTAVADLGAYELELGLGPAEGTIGTEVTLTLPGGGFGDGKPKVYLEVTDPDTAKTKNVAFKTLTYSDDVVEASWKKKVPAGEYPLVVQPKGKGIAPMPMGIFRVQIPVVTGFVPAQREGAVGDEVTINGRYFGSGKPQVLLRYQDGSGKTKKCKVTSASMDPVTGVSSVVFEVPKVPPGQYAAQVASKIGENDTPYDFEVLP